MGRARIILGCALGALAVAAGALTGTARAAQGTIPWQPCPHTNEFACAKIPVPLDPGGTVPGEIDLSARRHLAPVGEAKTAVVALAGGPGQAANPFASFFAQILGPILNTRDLIVFDQRGTGSSGPLRCRSAEKPGDESLRQVAKRCAKSLGAARAFYTTAQSVEDIESILQQGGYEKVVLYGTSYGTKVAEQFAQDHPEQVEGLVLDSVVAPNGPDQLLRSTLKAVPRVLGQICAGHACHGITKRPARDLRRLLKRMRRRGPLLGHAVGARGQKHAVLVSSAELLDLLIAGDLEPVLRAEFPAAVRSALRGDDAALARLDYRATHGSGESGSEGIDVPLYYDTTCEEESFPWQRSSSPHRRLHEADHAARAIPRRILGAFTPQDVIEASDMQACAWWPNASTAPLVDEAPMPAVPTLILSGAQDLRTPTSDARALAREIPGSHLLVVPDTGHSVLGTDRSGCAEKALQALFSGATIKRCKHEPTPAALRPAPLAPDRLSGIHLAHGQHGRRGRTARAVSLTLRYLAREITTQLESAGPVGLTKPLDTGGLRGGWAADSPRGAVLHRYSYVPGVVLSGRLEPGETVRVAGRAAAHGTIRLGARGRLSGVLAGRRVRVPAVSPTQLTALGR